MPDLSPDVERELEALDDALAGRRVASDLIELGDLALLLRDDRPEPSADFSRHLDTRAARGFRERDPRARASGRRWQALFSVPALGTAAVVLLIAVFAITSPDFGQDDSGGGGEASVAMQDSDDAGSGSGGSTGSASGGSTASESADSVRSGGGVDQSTTVPEPQTALAAPPVPDRPGSPGSDGRANRKVERSASITLAARPRDIDTVSARIQDVTRQQGGFVVTSSVNSSRRGGHGEFRLRIPTRNLDATMSALSGLGAVRERADRSEDITAESVSARSRLKDARTERESLLKQLADADTIPEAASIRGRLKVVSGEIARARAEVRRVNNRAAFSTVAVTLVADRSAVAPGTEEDDGSWSPGDAAHDALRVLEVIAGVALIAIAIALPLALVALLIAVSLRLARRRRREHALDAI